MDSPDYISPPPAYSEQEFDQKISQATLLSLHTSSTNIGPDGWPLYDPAAFQDPITSESPSTSSPTTERSSASPMETSSANLQVPSVVPLRIEKKNQRSLAKTQQRNENSSLAIGNNPTPALYYSETSNRNEFRSRSRSVQSTGTEDDGSLMSLTSQTAHKRDASLYSMPSPPLFRAQPPLPPGSNYDNHYQQQVDPYNVTPSQSPRQSPPSRPRFVPQERPMSNYPPSPNNFQPSYIPDLDFNPSIAYGRTQPATPLKFDPHALYNSAVSAQITASGQHRHSSSHSSYSSRDSFSPQKQYQQSAAYARPGHYSQTFASQDPLSSDISTSPFEVNNSRQSILQSPARPPSTYSMSSNYQTSPSPAYHQYVSTANVPGNIYYDPQGTESRWNL